MGLLAIVAALCLFGSAAVPMPAQKGDDALSQREIDQLRDAAFQPTDRLSAFIAILNSRERRIEALLTRRKGHTDFAENMHDVLEQFSQITDELNNNLDDYNHRHRDIRKALPKLVEATEHWSATLQGVGENQDFNVVLRIARDNLKDTNSLATSLQSDLNAYFKAHPEAEAAEKKRVLDPHAVHGTESPEP